MSIGKQGIQIETKEKTNVMSPASNMAYLIYGVGVALILFTSELWIKVFGIFFITFYFVIWIIIYISHSIKNPALLQSEVYRLEVQRIETGMLEDKTAFKIEVDEVTSSNSNLLLEDREDING